MLPKLCCYLLGPSWKSSLCGGICLVSGFIAASPDLFGKWPMILAAAKYLAIGTGAAGLRLARDNSAR